MAANNQMQQLVVHIEGNIGAGKSTLMEHLQSHFSEYLFVFEPVANWEKTLSLVSSCPKQGYEFLLQLLVADDLIKINKQIKISTKNVIVERSTLSSIHVFAQDYLNKKRIQKEHYYYLEHKLDKAHIHFDLCIFIDTSIHLCLDRITRRGRKCEYGINEEYLMDINKLYKKMLLNMQIQGAQIHIINGNQPPLQVFQDAVSAIISLLKK